MRQRQKFLDSLFNAHILKFSFLREINDRIAMQTKSWLFTQLNATDNRRNMYC